MEPDWDLLAVVRGCTSSSSSSATATFPGDSPAAGLPTPPPPGPNCSRLSSGSENLQDLYKPFSPIPQYPISTPPFAQSHQIMFQQQTPQQVKPSQLIFGSSNTSTISADSNNIKRKSAATISQIGHQKPKKRKTLQKKICQVPVEGIASDVWAWRKYGQKPIKGSPYPRGYYKCSSSKGCPARKQVERDRSNPKMFTITYTSEHNHPIPTHRNSLAGSTRQKPATAASPSSDQRSSPAEVKTENGEEEGAQIDDMVLRDDFFVGFEELDDRVEGSAEVDFPWVWDCGSAAAAAGGS